LFLPIGDTPNPRNFKPWVNWTLIAVNVAIFIFIAWPLSAKGADPTSPLFREYFRHLIPSQLPPGALRQFLYQVTCYDLFIFEHGYKAGAPGLLDLFFSMFLHANLWHLAGNMLFLWIYGDNVEHRLGRVGYLLAYLLTGVGATLFFSAFAGSSMTPMVGASGAISGVLGLYFLLFPRNEVKVLVFFFFITVILLPARLVLGFYLIADNLLPFIMKQQTGVAYGAHIGGFIVGLGIAWTGERLSWRWPWSDSLRRIGRAPRRRRKTAKPVEEDLLSEVRSAMNRQDFGRAVQTVARIDKKDFAALTPRECVRLSQWLEETGHPIAAAGLLRSCISCHVRSKDLAEVYLLLGLMRLRQGQPTAAYQHLLSVFDFDPDPEIAARAREALNQIEIYRRRPPPPPG
jgi:membrane associated rhomboid family serine protease